MNTVYLLTGSNLGDRMDYLIKATNAIEKSCGNILAQSPFYETEAWGLKEQNPFVNQALCISTPFIARNLLDHILKIEKHLGRTRDLKYGARTIDIDILLFNNDIMQEPGLTVPHPQLHHRRFALQCLDDIATEKIHPVLNKTIAQLLAECSDPLAVNKIN